MLDRRRFLSTCSSHALAGTLLPGALYALLEQGRPVTARTIACAEDIAGLSLTDEERELLVEDLNGQVEDYAQLRALELANSVAPSLVFDPRLGGPRRAAEQGALRFEPPAVRRPPEPESLAFKSVAELAHLLKSRQVTSIELTELYLSRLRQHDEVLQVVVTLTEETALEEAARADIELDAGIWRGPLHGVPYGAKDLLSVKGYPTTWGAEPYRAQVIEEDAAVVERLRSAGAVLVAKLTLGALAWGDVWRQDAQSVESGRRLQRLVGRTGCGRGGRTGGICHWLRDAGLHRVSLYALRRDGAPAYLRPGKPPRRHDTGVVDGQAGPHGPVGAGLCTRVRRCSGAGSAR